MTKIADARRQTCRSCGAQIVWAVTLAGKAMPVDPDPVPDGNLTDVESEDGEHTAVVVRSLGLLDEGAEGERFVSHFATCRDAAAWRKR